MPLLSFGGWAFGVPVPDFVSSALTQARGFNLSQFGSNTQAQNTQLAKFINLTVTELIENNPAINQTKDYPNLVVATTQGTNIIPVPADMMGQEILTMLFYDSSQSPWMLLNNCNYAGPQKWAQLPPEWRNGTYRQRDPAYWSFDITAENQAFAPWPNDATVQLERTYRPNPTPILPGNTSAMFGSGQLLPGWVTTVAGSPVVQGDVHTRFTSAVTPLSGLVTTHVATAALTGIGTAFTAELVVGSTIVVNGNGNTILTITNDTMATLTSAFGQDNTSLPYYRLSGTAQSNTVTLAAGSSIMINGTSYVIDQVASASLLILRTPALAAGSVQTFSSVAIIGEIPQRFVMVPVYRLAAYMVEMINKPLYAELMAKYQGAMDAMQAEITDNKAAQQANMNREARPTNIMDLYSLYPACQQGGDYWTQC